MTEFMKIRICRMRILMYKSVRMRILKKLKYDTINTDNIMQSTNITSNDCQCEWKIEI